MSAWLLAVLLSTSALDGVVLDGFAHVGEREVRRYIAAYGEEFVVEPLPRDIALSPPNNCYENATVVALEHRDLTYAEGFALGPRADAAIAHAWNTRQGSTWLARRIAIDTSIRDTKGWRYVGVVYDREKYLEHVAKTGHAGVLGAPREFALSVLRAGGEGASLMPKPGPREKEKDFVARCVSIVLEDETARDGAQAAAICHSMWRDAQKKRRSAVYAVVTALADGRKVVRILSNGALSKARSLGGPGSGNFGHAGRPGEVGGSAADGGGTQPAPAHEERSVVPLQPEQYKEIADEYAVHYNVPITVEEYKRSFKVGNQEFQEGGHYDPRTASITINQAEGMTATSLDGILAHEVTHHMEHTVKEEFTREQEAISREIIHGTREEYNRVFQPNGFPRPEVEAEMKKRFPLSSALAKVGLFGNHLTPERGDKLDALMKDDGCTQYSTAYWEAASGHSGRIDTAMSETLAEVGKFLEQPRAYKWTPGSKTPTPRWRGLYRLVRSQYTRITKGAPRRWGVPFVPKPEKKRRVA